jgi:diacylglycerol kinase (ATP)
MYRFIRRHHISFKNAIAGIRWAFTTQPNFRIHTLFATLAIFAGIVLRISSLEMSMVLLIIVFGIGCEMVNTAIESMTDLIKSEWHQQAKIAKDVSAGMVLIAAVGAVLMAMVIFLPRIFLLIG